MDREVSGEGWKPFGDQPFMCHMGKWQSPRGNNSGNRVFSLLFPYMFGQNHSQDLRGPQLIILTKYGRISTTPDPICNDFTFLFFLFLKKMLLFF